MYSLGLRTIIISLRDRDSIVSYRDTQTYKTAKINSVTSGAEYIIHSFYYAHGFLVESLLVRPHKVSNKVNVKE